MPPCKTLLTRRCRANQVVLSRPGSRISRVIRYSCDHLPFCTATHFHQIMAGKRRRLKRAKRRTPQAHRLVPNAEDQMHGCCLMSSAQRIYREYQETRRPGTLVGGARQEQSMPPVS
jgi:hypothetical protein